MKRNLFRSLFLKQNISKTTALLKATVSKVFRPWKRAYITLD